MSLRSAADGPPAIRPGTARLAGIALLALLAPAATLARNVLGQPGIAAVAAVLATGAALLVARGATRGGLPRRTFDVLLGSLPLVAVYAVSSLADPSLDAIANLGQVVLVVGFYTGMALVRWDRRAVMPLFWVSFALLALHVLWWGALGFPRIFRGYMGHPNGLGMFTYLLSAFPLLVFLTSRRFSTLRNLAALGLLLALVLLYATTSRSAWLAAFASFVVIAAWPALTRRRWRFQATFVLACVAVLVGTWLYLVAPNTEWGWRLQELSVRLTTKNFFSGRQLYWDALAAAVAERPLLGHGAGTEAQSVTGFSWSSHNLYLQTTLQVGFVGLAALFVLLWVVWRQLWHRRRTPFARVAGAFLVGTLVHQMFEVSLTQVNLANGFLVWLVLAIGSSRAEAT